MKLTQFKFEDMVILNGNQVMTNSLKVADYFSKRHKDVLKKIRIVIKDANDEEYTRLHFAPFDFIDKNGDLQPAFNLTRNGFMLLVMGFTGKDALPIKISYMQAFDWMAEQLYKMQHGYMEQQNSAWLEYTKEKDKASVAGKSLSRWGHSIKPALIKKLEKIQNESQIKLLN